MKALLVVDMQNDFMPGGSLAVENGDETIPLVNNLMQSHKLVIATQDWHPKNHSSFASQHTGYKVYEKISLDGEEQILWPDHCVQGSTGAEFHSDLQTNEFETIFRKGTSPSIDSYSGFYDNQHKKSTGLAGYLRERKVEELQICGLAGDFCVYYTIKDALQEGFDVTLYKEATKPIDRNNFEEQLKELNENKKFCVT